jgi:zinc and cadmium transporter
MTTLAWIVGSTAAMSLLSWIGLIVAAFREETLKKLLLPLVALSAGALMGGACLHLIPEAMTRVGPRMDAFVWVLLGFSLFFLMEQFLSWHHHHAVPSEHKEPFTYLILVADGLHNFIGGLAVGGSFLAGIEVGIITWIAAAAHEIPQELGDFGILLRGGWKKNQALFFNFVSALTIVPGGIIAYFASSRIDTTFLLLFAAGNFLYIAASDLIPEVKARESLQTGLVHFVSFLLGVGVILVSRLVFS